MSRQAPGAELLQSWRRQAHRHPRIAAGLLLAAAALLLLLLAGLLRALGDGGSAHLGYALLGGTAGFLATALGALLTGCTGVSPRGQDAMLGFAAGMMLAASAFSLILPGLAAAAALLASKAGAALTVAAGMTLGTLLMLGLDCFTPHQHAGPDRAGSDLQRLGRVWLFVLAIVLHNLPEGMAIGVGFAGGDLSVGVPLTSAIAIQDVPEGLAVAVALRSAGLGTRFSVLVAVASGLMEPLGALVGLGLSSGFALAYPLGLGFAAGAMIFVVSHEMIPETHSNGHQTPATLGLMAGFVLMMFLDSALG